ncbi:polysaccharide pyruvyl transferase family protein [Salsuginibacillus kocurii]|uniref:polysaccharide pyruvyl transferase family protein n=1 Tax=Salsuginibacillus kocurii TaxID=427078 RepID=UPI00036ADC5E|nr:polysaccharide pyruvyl transferase family protein [Salsuginibacillus kocurii]
MKKMKVALHGAYQGENFGDELLMYIQSQWINKLTEFELVMPYAHKVYREQIGAGNVKGFEALKQADKLIYGGGGYFGEPNSKVMKWGGAFFKKKHPIPAEYFNYKKRPYIINGVGAGPISNLLTRHEVKRICNNASRVIVRDEESMEYLTHYGVKSSKLDVTSDIVLSLNKDENVIKVKDHGLLSPSSSIKNRIGLHMNFSIKDPTIKRLLDSLIEFFNEREDVEVVLIADKRNSEAQEKVIEYVGSKLIHTFKVYRHQDIHITCAILKDIDAVITSKLHVAITSYTFDTPAFSIAKHQKTKRFFKQINLEECHYDIGNLSEEHIEKLFHFLSKVTESKFAIDYSKKEELVNLATKNKYFLENFLISRT